MSSYFIAPHPDDEVLFGAYTIMREKPTVVIVTHPTLQGDNGYERVLESYKACQILGAKCLFLGIPEHELTEDILKEKLPLTDEIIYIPDLEGGNPHHDIVHRTFNDHWNVKLYKTYNKDIERTGKLIEATSEEREIKHRAMACHKTQIMNPLTSHFFNSLEEYE
jgi:LmbE family N-acetylglucosaminyl deacetylase